MRFKGLHDIKTHGSLDHEGRLIGVAKNLHRMGSRENGNGKISDDWSVKQYICPKKKLAKFRQAFVASPYHDFFSENKVKLYQIEVIQDSLQEMRQAMAEGILVSKQELNRLIKKLSELEVE